VGMTKGVCGNDEGVVLINHRLKAANFCILMTEKTSRLPEWPAI
jgi:hypothetical protein